MGGPNFLEPPDGPAMTLEQLAELSRRLQRIQDEIIESRVVATFNAHSEYGAKILADAHATRLALDDFYNWLRSQNKHGPETLNTEEVFQTFPNHLGDHLGD